MAVQAAVLLARMAGAPCVRAEQSAVERPLHGVLNDTRQYRGQLHASEAKPKRSLETAAAKAMSLGVSVVAIPIKSPPNPSSIHQVESIQSVGSVGSIESIHPKKGTFPIGIAFSAHHP